MTRFLLIRHGLTDMVGYRITSWRPDVHLNETGRAQAAALPALLEHVAIDAIFASPLERAQETAAPLAAARNIEVQTRDAFGEVRFGDFTGETIADLRRTDEWNHFEHFRAGRRSPNGEFAVEVQARFVAELENIRATHDGKTVAVFSHADAIKAVLALYLGVSLDLFDRIYVSPSSVNVVDVDNTNVLVRHINWTGKL